DKHTALRGFVRSAGGKISQIDVTGATDTEPQAINDAGSITGFYTDTNTPTTASSVPKTVRSRVSTRRDRISPNHTPSTAMATSPACTKIPPVRFTDSFAPPMVPLRPST